MQFRILAARSKGNLVEHSVALAHGFNVPAKLGELIERLCGNVQAGGRDLRAKVYEQAAR